MSLQDPVADMLTRIRNAQARKKESVSMPFSKLKKNLASALQQAGYLKSFEVKEEEGKLPELLINLKYFEGKPVIELLKRVSKPSLRIYKKANELPRVVGGLGVAMISTSKGLMTDSQARKEGLGGEVICFVA